MYVARVHTTPIFHTFFVRIRRARETVMPPRVLASGPKPCGANNLGHFKANLFDRAAKVVKAGKNRRFSGMLELEISRTKHVAKTPIPQVLARVSLCWPPMSIWGKIVDTLRACKRSNRDFFPPIFRKYLHSLQSSSILRGES